MTPLVRKWVIVTGEYPPAPGGVADYTRTVARALAAAGDEVDVWAPEARGREPADAGVAVHRLRTRFHPAALVGFARKIMGGGRGRTVVLVQYVPHAFGLKAMNLPFCAALRLLARRFPVWIVFHEVAFPLLPGQPLKHRILALTHRFMARVAAGSASRILITVPAWAPLLRRLAPRSPEPEWTPIPSILDDGVQPDREAALRRSHPAREAVIGHFGTYGEATAAPLESALASLLRGGTGRRALLAGRGSDAFAASFERRWPDLAGRIRGAGELSPGGVAEFLSECDLLIQPYPDGASSRRSSLMTGLFLGLPVVTSQGHSSEDFWRSEGAVALAASGSGEDLAREAGRLLENPAAREEFGTRAAALYRRRFSLESALRSLRREAA